mmetsp:Transcript_74468/g.206824  ORF Transcript_74468/g.206824 Transcript_74468/m.206824 type:complete len:252 (+) Transcript_74468:1191-1946(+)
MGCARGTFRGTPSCCTAGLRQCHRQGARARTRRRCSRGFSRGPFRSSPSCCSFCLRKCRRQQPRGCTRRGCPAPSDLPVYSRAGSATPERGGRVLLWRTATWPAHLRAAREAVRLRCAERPAPPAAPSPAPRRYCRVLLTPPSPCPLPPRAAREALHSRRPAPPLSHSPLLLPREVVLLRRVRWLAGPATPQRRGRVLLWRLWSLPSPPPVARQAEWLRRAGLVAPLARPRRTRPRCQPPPQCPPLFSGRP